MRSICEQPLQGIILMILHFKKSSVLIGDQNLQISFTSIQKIQSVSGHSHCLFTSCLACLPWLNDARLGPHVLNGYVSMTSNPNEYMRDPTLDDIWRPNYRNMKYKSSLCRRQVKRPCECPEEWIVELV